MSQVPDNTPTRDLMAGRVSVFGDMTQWDQDHARVKSDLESLKGEFVAGLKEGMKEAADGFRETLKGVVEDVRGLVADLNRLQTAHADQAAQTATVQPQHQEQPPPQPSPQPTGTQTMTLDDDSKAALQRLQDSIDQLASIMAQRG